MSLRIAQLSASFFVAGQIRAADLETLAGYGIRSIVNNRPDGEDPGQPDSAEIEAAAQALGLAYSHVPVVSGWMTQQNVEDFNRACRSLDPPILLFCRSGTRSAQLWSLSEHAG
jgi:sulfide:quinone oxidoreductase